MVATKLSEVVSKGYDWAATPSKAPPPPASQSQSSSDAADQQGVSSWTPSFMWNAASNSLSSAADQAYSTLADAASYAVGGGGGDSADGMRNPNVAASSWRGGDPSASSSGQDISSWTPSGSNSNVHNAERRLSFGSPWQLKNPYNRVRGRYALNHSSLSAVRSLLPLVEDEDDYSPAWTDLTELSGGEPSEQLYNETTTAAEPSSGSIHSQQQQDSSVFQTPSPKWRRASCPYLSDPPSLPGEQNNKKKQNKRRKNSETASQLAEGTVRALRDIALDEAVEFHEALRFWSERWEHPLLSWLEAGPTVWFSKQGYDHQVIGQKVADIQAVLARRCAGIGELQQHLLRAGWQRGVAQWGVLGHGGQWATVQGTTVMTEDTYAVAASEAQRRESHRNLLGSTGEALDDMGNSAHKPRYLEKIGTNDRVSPWKKRKDKKSKREKGYYASVFVRNEDNGQILMDNAALAEWSVDAMELIRNLLVRASNGQVRLPYEENWKPKEEVPSKEPKQEVPSKQSQSQQPSFGQFSETDDNGDLIVEEHRLVTDPQRQLPFWARWAPKRIPGDEGMDQSTHLESDDAPLGEEEVVISNLPLMAAEVSELLNSIEEIMPAQKHRRLRKLKVPSMFRRRWYLSAVGAPMISYVVYNLIKRGLGSKVIRLALSKIVQFFQERVYEPTLAIIEEIWKGREGMSDKKARMEVIAGLKEMIRSWLNDFHPELPAEERARMAELMDISLIEQKKAESMKSIFELKQAVRLSFIEMQYIKKEMVNALYTMDEMMSSNDINVNLAAVTPAVLLLYTTKQFFKFFYYAFLKLGKRKEETYASFRQILTDIERLLVMRDNPPSSPYPYLHRRQGEVEEDTASQSQLVSTEITGTPSNNVLGADDLGMLMLHIHECRTILWKEYSRFSPGVIQSVSEDLAELAGERGAVSVQQQLQIISRMCRTYPFLKVISIGTTFHENFIGGYRT